MSLCFRRRTLLHWMKTSEKSTVKTQKIIARTTINVCMYWHLHMLLAILWGLQNHFSQLILGLRGLPYMKSPFQWEEGSKIEEKVITYEKFYLYRGFWPYANFITKVFQKKKIALNMRIYALCFGLFYFISAIFWLFLPNLANANFG